MPLGHLLRLIKYPSGSVTSAGPGNSEFVPHSSRFSLTLMALTAYAPVFQVTPKMRCLYQAEKALYLLVKTASDTAHPSVRYQ